MHPRSLRAVLVALLCLVGASGCRLTEVSAYNLREVHDADGTPRRRGKVRGYLGYSIDQVLALTQLGQPTFLENPGDEEIDDPLGVCFENLSNLLDEDLGDDHTRAVAIEMVTWLSGDCTYSLSRERCAEALRALGREIGCTGPAAPLAEGQVAASAEVVAAALETLVRTAGPQALGGPGAFRGDPRTLTEAAAGVLALPLDRDGARRALAVTNILLTRAGFAEPGFAPVLEAHRTLERRCVELSLAALLADPAQRVRGAAVDAWIRLGRGTDPAPLEHGLADGALEPVLAAVRSLARHGAPIGAADSEAERTQALDPWMSRVIDLLRRFPQGPVHVAACRAMARLSGTADDLHPEHWVAWWEERRAGTLSVDGARE